MLPKVTIQARFSHAVSRELSGQCAQIAAVSISHHGLWSEPEAVACKLCSPAELDLCSTSHISIVPATNGPVRDRPDTQIRTDRVRQESERDRQLIAWVAETPSAGRRVIQGDVIAPSANKIEVRSGRNKTSQPRIGRYVIGIAEDEKVSLGSGRPGVSGTVDPPPA
jgi:hypothetical protein